MLSNVTRRAASLTRIPVRFNGHLGEGAGKGGGKGGAIRDAGGAFGKRAATHEEDYFRKKQNEQLRSMREHMQNEIQIHEENIRLHKEAIERHKALLHNFKKKD